MCDHVPMGDQAAAALAAAGTVSLSTPRLRQFPFPRQPLSSLAAGEFGRASAFRRPLRLPPCGRRSGQGRGRTDSTWLRPNWLREERGATGAPLWPSGG